MSVSSDDSERFMVNTLEILMRLYRMYDTKEESSSVLISALAHHLSIQYGIKSENDLENTCDKVKDELEERLKAFLSDRK